MGLRNAVHTSMKGFKAMLPALVILVLAWALADVCRALNTSGYLIEQVSFSFTILPLVTFLLAAGIAFSTGTSWGTMAILVPLTLSYATELSVGADPSQSQGVILAGLGAVLAGAVFGDHCSPISDTTVRSSMASGCDHIDHVRTQLPYALTVAAVAIVAGYLPAGLGYSPFLSLAVGAGILVMILLVAGRRVS
jgi:Na+/H+ antiporter NhaC